MKLKHFNQLHKGAIDEKLVCYPDKRINFGK